MMRVFKIILPVLILALGFGAYQLLASMREPPQRVARSYAGPLVEAIAAPLQQVQVVVEGQGTVRPDAQIDLVPQVSGIVVWKDADFKPGGTFAKGALLFRIDSRDYELAVQQAAVQVAQARYQLDLAREEAAIAEEEWQRLHAEEVPTDLVLRKPQLRAAEASLQGAEARLAEARLRLDRTNVYAPFAGRVRTARVDVGQHLNAGQSIAQLYSIEKAEIVVPVPDEDLGWFTLPLPIDIAAASTPNIGVVSNPNAEGGSRAFAFSREGASAEISGAFAGRRHQWSGARSSHRRRARPAKPHGALSCRGGSTLRRHCRRDPATDGGNVRRGGHCRPHGRWRPRPAPRGFAPRRPRVDGEPRRRSQHPSSASGARP